MNAALSQTEVPAQYLTFTLGAETFALKITQIKEIIEYGHLTPVPMMPEFIRGVINLRGRVVPAIDLKARFNRDAVAVGKRTCIVIIEVIHDDSQYDIGIVVDAVSAVLDIAGSDIEPAPAFGAKIRSDFIQGMAKVEGEFIIILDVAKVLSVDEMVMLAEANQMTPPVQADISR